MTLKLFQPAMRSRVKVRSVIANRMWQDRGVTPANPDTLAWHQPTPTGVRNAFVQVYLSSAQPQPCSGPL